MNLFKKQKEVLQKNIEIKRKLLEEVKLKQKDIQDIAQQTTQQQSEKSQINKLLKILIEFRNTNQLNNNTNRDKNILIENIYLESDIQKKSCL